MKKAEDILIKHLLKVNGCVIEDIHKAIDEDPTVYNAILDAMEEYKNAECRKAIEDATESAEITYTGNILGRRYSVNKNSIQKLKEKYV